MSSKDNNIEVVVKAIDEFSKALGDFHNYVQKIGVQADSTAKNVKTLSDRFSGLEAVLTGGLMKMGADIFSALERGIGDLVNALPQAVEAGYAWAEQIQQLQVETGMTAQQTSALAAVMREMGVDMGSVSRLFAMFGVHLTNNEALFTSLGIATRDAKGQLLDTYTIIRELQQAFSSHGDSLQKTAAAQELFSRTGYTMLEFLNLTDAQMKTLIDDAGGMGMVLDESTTAAAHRFSIEMGNLGNIVTGLQTSIFAGLEPMLESFVDAFGNFVKQNMDTIVNSVISVASFIAGVISGIFGIDMSATTLAGSLTADGGPTSDPTGHSGKPAAPVDPHAGQKWVPGTPGTPGTSSHGGAKKDPYVESIKEQTDAINKQIAALTALDNVQQASKQQADLETAIAGAKTELANLQASGVNTYGLSAAEQIKAQQKRAADILAAQGKVQTSEVSLADWKKQQDTNAQKAALDAEKQHLADLLSAHQAANGTIVAGVKAIPPIVGHWIDDATATLGKGLKDYSKTISDSMKAGQGAVDDWRKKLGPLWDILGAVGDIGSKFVVPVLGSLWGMAVSLVGPLINVVVWLNNFLAPVGGLAGAIEHALNPLPDLLKYLGNVGDAFGTLLKNIKGFVDSLPKIPSIGIPGLAAGGVVEPRPGGTLVNVGEGGEREYIIPASKMPKYGGSGGVVPAPGGRSGSVRQVTQFVIGERVLFEFVDGVLARRGAMS